MAKSEEEGPRERRVGLRQNPTANSRFQQKDEEPTKVKKTPKKQVKKKWVKQNIISVVQLILRAKQK